MLLLQLQSLFTTKFAPGVPPLPPFHFHSLCSKLFSAPEQRTSSHTPTIVLSPGATRSCNAFHPPCTIKLRCIPIKATTDPVSTSSRKSVTCRIADKGRKNLQGSRAIFGNREKIWKQDVWKFSRFVAKGCFISVSYKNSVYCCRCKIFMDVILGTVEWILTNLVRKTRKNLLQTIEKRGKSFLTYDVIKKINSYNLRFLCKLWRKLSLPNM